MIFLFVGIVTGVIILLFVGKGGAPLKFEKDLEEIDDHWEDVKKKIDEDINQEKEKTEKNNDVLKEAESKSENGIRNRKGLSTKRDEILSKLNEKDRKLFEEYMQRKRDEHFKRTSGNKLKDSDEASLTTILKFSVFCSLILIAYFLVIYYFDSFTNLYNLYIEPFVKLFYE